MQICTSLQIDNDASTPPLSFLQAGCPSCRPTNSVKALKAVQQQVNVKLYTAVSKSRSTIFSNEIFALPPENPADLHPATHISPAWGPISTNIHLSTAVIIPQRWRTQSSRRRSSWGLSAAFPPNSWCRRPTGCSQISVSTSDWFLSTSEV